MISTGMYLTRLLEAYDVDTVFGIPGVHTVELYRGLAGSSIRHITPRHEQGAGFMADGYARVSGKPGVCFIISGPGMTNIATAMGQAYGDSVPLLVISTVNSHGRMGSGDGWLHELPNQQALFETITAFSHTVHAPEELAPALARAFAVFDSARPRPVHIELPINVMLAAADHLKPPARVARLRRPVPTCQDLDKAIELLSRSKSPVILVGGGAVRASQETTALAERLDAPVVMTTNGRGLLSPEHPLAVSVSASFRRSRRLVENADVVVALGTELGPTDYDMYEDGDFSLPDKLIRIDIDPAQIVRGVPPYLGLVGDAGICAALLAEGLEPADRQGAARAAAVRSHSPDDVPPQTFGDLVILEAIRGRLPDAIYVGDSTQLVYSGNIGFCPTRPGSWFNSATGYGTLGYGLPAAIGAKAAAPGRPVIAVAGDGGVQFSIAEMASAKEAGLPIVLLLLDNKGYGEIKSYMISKNIPPLGVDLYTPDFLDIAKGYGWIARRVSCLKDLLDAVENGAASSEPTIVVFGQEVRDEAMQAAQSR